MLRKYLEEAVEAVDKAVAANISAVERMKKLLSSPDKKQAISDMAAANEIDVALIDLLQQVRCTAVSDLLLGLGSKQEAGH